MTLLGVSGTTNQLTTPNNSFVVGTAAVGALGISASVIASGTTRLAFGVSNTSYGTIWGSGTASNTQYRWATDDTTVLYNCKTGGSHNFNMDGSANMLTIDLTTFRLTQTQTGTSGVSQNCQINTTINQSSTAGYTAFRVNVTETATGSGAKLLADFAVGGTSRITFSNTGLITLANQTTTTGAAGGTLTNCPTAGNPTGYLQVSINGSIGKIPYWV